MISTVLFSLSALCFAAMLSPGKSSRRPAPRQDYTYYVGDNEPLPTWKRKRAPGTRVANRVG